MPYKNLTELSFYLERIGSENVQKIDFGTNYYVHKDGTVFCTQRDDVPTKGGKFRSEKAKIISARMSNGYLLVGLHANGKTKHISLHRLLCIAFKPDDLFDGWVVNHIDGNKLNNSLDNLEVVTQKQNIEHSYRTGLQPSYTDAQRAAGVRNIEKAREVKAKLNRKHYFTKKISVDSASEVVEAYFSDVSFTYKEIAKSLGVTLGAVSYIINTYKGELHAV
jgi:hypothetical protein